MPDKAEGSAGDSPIWGIYGRDIRALKWKLPEQSVEKPKAEQIPKKGSLLYHIPEKMQVAKETRCRIRIAFDKKTLLEKIQQTSNTKVEDIRIAEVMQVKLIDLQNPRHFPSAHTTARINSLKKTNTLSGYFVKPLREGRFLLLLQVSVIGKGLERGTITGKSCLKKTLKWLPNSLVKKKNQFLKTQALFGSWKWESETTSNNIRNGSYRVQRGGHGFIRPNAF
ncbi:MAG: hypothetical protein IPN20_03695 [Haliscomenobacter sp.]|nr:hypothetical protein [Haliscomenobacter sp.]